MNYGNVEKPWKKYIIFIPTFRCQRKCFYCDYRWKTIEEHRSYSMKAFGHDWMFREELHWAYWLTALYKWKPYHLEITGGEPTLWIGLIELIDHLPKACTWSITSNSLNDGVIDSMEPSCCKGWAASYHYDDTDKFMTNLKLLRMKGFPIKVTLVLTPHNIQKVKESMEMFSEKFIRVSVHPLLKQGHNWSDNEDVLTDIQEYIKKNDPEKLIEIITDIPKEYKPLGPIDECMAGSRYVTAFPDGRIFRCYTHALSEQRPPLGHVKDVQLRSESYSCDSGCIFPCDKCCREGRVTQWA
jgi:sulfatase maturation enzyme AslB (radical SAM superfamily)